MRRGGGHVDADNRSRRSLSMRERAVVQTHDERTWIAERFAADVRDLEVMLGWDCRDWLRAPPARHATAPPACA